MSGSFIILTVFEVLAAVLLIIGLFNENAIAGFEEKTSKIIRRIFSGRRRQCKQSRVRYYSKTQRSRRSNKRCA